MSKKILVADDSATIQKVVSITLANEPCELVEVLDSDTLFKKLEEDKFALVLLDFNLSEQSNGYDLAKIIKEKSPASKIIAMLGTFDSVENDMLEAAGIDDVVVKPFESNKFIQSCRHLLAASSNEVDIPTPAIDTVSNLPVEEFSSSSMEEMDEEDDDLANGWIAKTPDMEDMSSEDAKSDWNEVTPAQPMNMNALQSELEGWGMEIPSVIGHEDGDSSLLPPQIVSDDEDYSRFDYTEDEIFPMEETSEELQNESDVQDDFNEVTRPTQPFFQLDEESNEDEINQKVNFSVNSDLDNHRKSNLPEHHPAFQSIDDFNLQDDSEESADVDKTVEIQMEQFDLEKEIEEEENPETFWAVDESEDPYSVEEKVGEIVKFGPHGNQADEVPSNGLSEQDKEDIINELSARLRVMVEEVVKEYCESKVDTVAWEVIPDLAENLINKEIKQLSESL